MADDQTKDALGSAVTWLGGTGVLAGLGVLLRGLLSGAVTQEKEMREDLRAEVKRLREDQDKAQEQIEQLRDDLTRLTTTNLHLLASRADARAVANAYERELGRPPTVWPPDPTEPGPQRPG